MTTPSRFLAPILLTLCATLLQAQQPPSTPSVRRGACPFECCRLGHWVTHDTLRVYARERRPGAPLYRLVPGRRFTADSADFYTLKLGLIRVRHPFRLTDHLAEDDTTHADSATLAVLHRLLAPGDTIYLIGEVTEIGEQVWVRGVAAAVDQFWPEPGVDDDRAPATLIRPTLHEWWVHIIDRGRSGWVQAWDHQVDGADACA